MAMPTSRIAVPRQSARRHATVEEALDHAQQIVAEQGAGAVTVSEIARRLGMRPPSLYKYFSSLQDIYDALFARGNALLASYLDAALAAREPGLDRYLEAARAILRWSLAEPGLAPLMYWRPIPGFEPSPASYAPSTAQWAAMRNDLTVAVQRGQLGQAADSDDAMRMLTVLIAGIAGQYLANERGTPPEASSYLGLLDEALEMYVAHYAASR